MPLQWWNGKLRSWLWRMMIEETAEYASGYEWGLSGGDARLDSDSPDRIRGVLAGREFRGKLLCQGFKETATGEFEITFRATPQ